MLAAFAKTVEKWGEDVGKVGYLWAESNLGFKLNWEDFPFCVQNCCLDTPCHCLGSVIILMFSVICVSLDIQLCVCVVYVYIYIYIYIYIILTDYM